MPSDWKTCPTCNTTLGVHARECPRCHTRLAVPLVSEPAAGSRSRMMCEFHPDRPAHNTCGGCQKPLCAACEICILGQSYCQRCVYIYVSLPEVFARLARESGERVRLAREQERIAGELRIAHEMQAKLLPQAPPQIPGLEVSGFSDPCREVGGDYFDYWALSGNRLAVCIGDVTGKGVPAALMMAMVKSCLFTMVKDDASPGLILRTLGSMVRSLGDRHQLMTFLFAVIDPVRKVARFANAGHLYPYLLRPSQGKPVFLEANGLPLGAPCQVEYAEAEYAIQPDDRLIFSTDGFVEAHNTAGGMMGFERVQDVLETTGLQDCDTTIQTVLRSVRQFTGLAEVEDDRTIVVVRLKDCGNASV